MDVVINYVRSDGVERSVTARPGTTAMRAALSNGVAELLGDCDGEMTCGTCHVFVEPTFFERLAAMGAEEDEMLDTVAAGREYNSRLACQVTVSEALSGITVRTPSEQL